MSLFFKISSKSLFKSKMWFIYIVLKFLNVKIKKKTIFDVF